MDVPVNPKFDMNIKYEIINNTIHYIDLKADSSKISDMMQFIKLKQHTKLMKGCQNLCHRKVIRQAHT